MSKTTHRIGPITIYAYRINTTVRLRFRDDRDLDFAVMRDPLRNISHTDEVFMPWTVWEQLLKLFEIQPALEALQVLLGSNEGWPVSTGDDRTDLRLQNEAYASKLYKAFSKVMELVVRLKR